MNIMKKILPVICTGMLLFLFSCKNGLKQEDAIQINQEGIGFMNAGQYQQALQSFFRAIASPRLSKEDKGTIYRNIALTYVELDIKDSAAHFSTLAAKCYRKNSYDYLLNMSEVELLSGKTSSALNLLLKAVKIDPEDMAVNNSLGLIYLGDYDEDLIDLDKALMYNSKAFEISGSRVTEDVLGRTFYKMENYEKAETHYAHLLKDYPDMASYLVNMGMIKYRLKKRNEAEVYFEKGIRQDSSYKETISIFKLNNP